MKSEHQQRVEKFMHLAGQDVPVTPTTPSSSNRILRAKLIFEEAIETITKGLGVDIQLPSARFSLLSKHKLNFVFNGEFNMEETVDGCCDLMVVTTGTLSAIGVPDKPFQEEVDNNNLAKFGPGHYKDSDGKLIKPPGHKPPDINRILSELTLDHHDTEENPRG